MRKEKTREKNTNPNCGDIVYGEFYNRLFKQGIPYKKHSRA